MRAIEIILPIIIYGVGDDPLLVALPAEHAEVVADGLRGDGIVENTLFRDRET